jgi:hypothetical protein
MVLIFFALIAIFLIVRGFRMPEDFKQNQQVRSEIRKKRIVFNQEEAQNNIDDTDDDQVK